MNEQRNGAGHGASRGRIGLIATIACGIVLGLLAHSAPAQDDDPEDFAAFRANLARSSSAAVQVSVESAPDANDDEEATPIALEDALPSIAGLVGNHALTVDTLNRRAIARLNPGLKDVLVEDEYDAAVREVEQSLLYEWAMNTVLSITADDAGYTASEEEIEFRLQELAEAGGSPGEPDLVLAQYGLDPVVFRKELHAAILAEKYVMATLDATDTELLRRAYDNNVDSFYRPERVRVRAIVQDLSRALDDADFQAQFQAMNDASRALDRGRAFGEVAREFSGAPVSRHRGGDMGWMSRDNPLPMPFRISIFDLEVGEPTDVLRSDDRRFLYIFEIVDKRPDEVVSFAEAREDVKMLMYDETRQRLYEESRRQYRIILNGGGVPAKYTDNLTIDDLILY